MHASPESFLEALDPFGIELGLERMRHLLRALGEPQNGLRILQIAGTNGKGSTAATATSILQAAGHEVGLYTSPHLVHLAERIRIGDRMIDEASLAEGVARLQRAMRRTGLRPTYFEALTAVAIDHFARQGVDIAVLEVGLGGRLDATSAVTPEVAIITRIGLDHMAVLGPTIAAIAAEKAAILRPGTTAIVARQVPEARAVIAAKARDEGCECLLAGRDFALRPASDGTGAVRDQDSALLSRCDVRMPAQEAALSLFFEGCHAGEWWGKVRLGPLQLALDGAHQIDNAEVAIAGAMAFTREIDLEILKRGLCSVCWPGRFQVVAHRPLVVVDGAHNPDGARALAATCRTRFSEAKPRLVFSALGDKDVCGIAEVLFPMAQSVHLSVLDNPRALQMQALAERAQTCGVTFECHATVADALVRACHEAEAEGTKGWVLAAGSLYLVGEVLRLVAQRGMS